MARMTMVYGTMVYGTVVNGIVLWILAIASSSGRAQSLDDLPINRWVKLSPLPDAPPSPRLGYEGACVWDSVRQRMIRYGGHNQGGGGEQHAETWSFDPLTAKWELYQPNSRPPGICCGQENIFNPIRGRYIRFPAFSHSHGWQWLREIYLNNSSIWSFDPDRSRWTEMRPIPAPHPRGLRCASWDRHRRVIVLFGGEGSSEGTWTYDPARNEWTKMDPPREPPPRSGGNMVYDAARKLHILFGAQFTDDPHTWAYDLSANRWIDLQPPTMPPTDRNDAVLAYDSIHHVVLALVKSAADIERQKKKGESSRSVIETWCYDAGTNRWTRLEPTQSPDPSSNRSRQLMFAPEYNVFLLENRTRRAKDSVPEQQIWAYRYAEATADAVKQAHAATRIDRDAIVSVVDDLAVSVMAADRVMLTWSPLKQADLVGYHVERAIVEVYSTDQLVHLKSRTPPLNKPSVGAIRRFGEFEVLTSQPVERTGWEDRDVDLARPAKVAGDTLYDSLLPKAHIDGEGEPYRYAVYAYRVRAVDRSGNIGGPSPAVLTIPGPVENLFAKEEGDACRLRWQANRERGIAGYRVYRIDGRGTKLPVRRLTADLVGGHEFLDSAAGERGRRYHVVAVDTIGQEGHPSPPVWYRREWQRFYTPFASEWHQ